MAISHVRYPLHDGFIHNWLVVGPQAIEVEDLASFTGERPKTPPFYLRGLCEVSKSR